MRGLVKCSGHPTTSMSRFIISIRKANQRFPRSGKSACQAARSMRTLVPAASNRNHKGSHPNRCRIITTKPLEVSNREMATKTKFPRPGKSACQAARNMRGFIPTGSDRKYKGNRLNQCQMITTISSEVTNREMATMTLRVEMAYQLGIRRCQGGTGETITPQRNTGGVERGLASHRNMSFPKPSPECTVRLPRWVYLQLSSSRAKEVVSTQVVPQARGARVSRFRSSSCPSGRLSLVIQLRTANS